MIPDEKAERDRLREWLWRDLVAEWYVVDHAEARGHCVNEPVVEKFEKMVDRVLRSVERYEVGLAFPTPTKNRKIREYQDDRGGPAPPPPPKVVETTDADLFNGGEEYR